MWAGTQTTLDSFFSKHRPINHGGIRTSSRSFQFPAHTWNIKLSYSILLKVKIVITEGSDIL
jgi:hypothetical protein